MLYSDCHPLSAIDKSLSLGSIKKDKKKRVNGKVKQINVRKELFSDTLSSENKSDSSFHQFDKEGFLAELNRSLSQETIEEAACWDPTKLLEFVEGIKAPLNLVAWVLKSIKKININN